MSAFSNSLKRAARRVLERSGETVVITKRNRDRFVGIVAHVQTDAEFTNEETRTIDYRTEIEVMTDDVNELSRGDEVLTEDETVYRVEQVIQNDRVTIRATLLEVRK